MSEPGMSTCRYTRAHSVDEALACLAAAQGEAHIVAGGVALGILMNQRLVEPTWLIDISRIEALKRLEVSLDGSLRIGALVTHREIERSDVVAAACPLLTEMCIEVACARIRNRGTIGGNICLADPQGDPPVALLALGASLRVVGLQGPRDVPVREFFKDLYTTALRGDEVLQEIGVARLPDNAGAAYGKFGARRAMDYASTISAAAWLVRDPGDGRITAIGLGLGGVGATPVWPAETQALLLGTRAEPEALGLMRDSLYDEIAPMEDCLFSADYKRHVATVMLRRTVERAYARAGAKTRAQSA